MSKLKRVLLVARLPSIEPLGIMHLAGVAAEVGWECRVVLPDNDTFSDLYRVADEWRPDLVGFQIWTGPHKPMFDACDYIRALGIPVAIGGPHATYFGEDCLLHAEYVVRGCGFGLFRNVLRGLTSVGMHFDKKGRSEAFPVPNRVAIYDQYPQFANSPIKSMIASVGCPFFCTYCYASEFNKMHGGFLLTVRPVPELVTEALAVISRWPLKMMYFQDDVFGFDLKWLEEFSRTWQNEVGIHFHCQIRLELTRGESGDLRLDMLKKAGCSGITLAIESGSAFLRDHVLFRHMSDNLIIEGCRKILDRGMTLRTEQILAVPFSSIQSDIGTLELNSVIKPTMAWTSILAPYLGTDIGTIATNFGLYYGNNNELDDTFFDRSVLRHVEGGCRDIEEVIRKLGSGNRDRVMLKLSAQHSVGNTAVVLHREHGEVGNITYLDSSANDQYVSDVVRLQRLFDWLVRIPSAGNLARKLLAVPKDQWSWTMCGGIASAHIEQYFPTGVYERVLLGLSTEMSCSPDVLPLSIKENPYMFGFFQSGGVLANSMVQQGVFTLPPDELFRLASTIIRRHQFQYSLYKISAGADPLLCL